MSEIKLDCGLFGEQDAFEVLLGDVMRAEPFPREIQDLGYASQVEGQVGAGRHKARTED